MLSLSFACTAFAQYVWKDDKGVRQYSDRPPPASVPDSRIIKAPGLVQNEAPTAPPDADSTSSVDKEDAKPQSLAERNAEYQKRRAEQQEKEKKLAEESKKGADRQRACANARSYQNALDSGERISRMGTNGEREFLSDSQRAQESQRNRKVLDSCK
jgi:uncharacterized protein involved in type VI secretion and phage assembly